MNDLKIIEPISKCLKEFENVEDFNIFYNKHKNDMDALSTHKLNKMYHIKGYHITKIKNVLMLKKIKDSEKNIDSYNIEITELKQEIQNIKETINNIIHFINPHAQDNIVLPPSDT